MTIKASQSEIAFANKKKSKWIIFEKLWAMAIKFKFTA